MDRHHGRSGHGSRRRPCGDLGGRSWPRIPAEDLAHIFKPFYRGPYARDRQIHGNGLGLSLVKRIAEAHGGRVNVKSAPGEGTTFTLVLPFASGAAGTTALALNPAEGPSA
jgi:nitrogen-specific signal transduction histidine kinase